MPENIDFGLVPTITFVLSIAFVLALDLGVFNRSAHVLTTKEAAIWSTVWIALGFAFGGFLHYRFGYAVAETYITGYIIEKSLSVDNIFVFVLIFSYFKVPRQYQKRVLFWGIMSAFVLRGVMILGGVALIERFHWLIYVFGVFLIYAGIRMGLHKDEALDPGDTWIVKLARRYLPISDKYDGQRFLTRDASGKLLFTPLFLVLVVVEFTDVLFALDSIPAIFAITRDPFIVYTSNVFAILGLRALYFLLAGVIDMFRFLKLGLAFILCFAGVKMLLADTAYKVDTRVALIVIVAVLALSVAASLIWRGTPKDIQGPPPA